MTLRKDLGIGDMLANLITDLFMVMFDGLLKGLLK